MAEDRDLAAARRTIDALVRRVEALEHQQGAAHFTVHRAMASLENTVEERTRALAASEARYRSLYHHSPDMILAVDASGTVVSANDRACRELGHGVEGSDLKSLFHPSAQASVQHLVSTGFETHEMELALADERTVSLTAARVLDLPDVWQVVLRDVTSRRILESELQHSRRLAAIGHLAAGVAHEINNPLAVIQLRVEIMRDMGLCPDEVDSQLRVIDEHVHRISRIVRNLQSFARPQPVLQEAVPVFDLVHAAVDIAELWLHKVHLILDLEPDDLAFYGDQGKLEQVLANLLTNASAAMKREGTVTIRGRRVDDQVILTLRDTGPGIPPDILERLFTPFVTGKSWAQGSGLGLAIAWTIVQEHGGTITASNPPGGGAQFELVLPAGDVTERTAEASTGLDEDTASGLRILVVEDEVSLLELIQDFAIAAGHEVTAATTLSDALEAIHDGPYDVVLTDIHLPDGDGLSLYDHLRRTDSELARRVVVMSGFFHEPTGPYRYLQKPFTRRDLIQVLDTLAAARRRSP